MSEELYRKEEKILRRQITHEVDFKLLKDCIAKKLKAGDFKIRCNNLQQSVHKKGTKCIQLILDIGKILDAKGSHVAVTLDAAVGGFQVAHLVGAEEIAKECQGSDTECFDTKIVMTKLVDH